MTTFLDWISFFFFCFRCFIFSKIISPLWSKAFKLLCLFCPTYRQYLRQGFKISLCSQVKEIPPVTIHAYEITFSLVNENIACYFYGFLLHVQLVNERIQYSYSGGTNPFMNENVSRPTGTQPYSFITKEQWGGKGRKILEKILVKVVFYIPCVFPFGWL